MNERASPSRGSRAAMLGAVRGRVGRAALVTAAGAARRPLADPAAGSPRRRPRPLRPAAGARVPGDDEARTARRRRQTRCSPDRAGGSSCAGVVTPYVAGQTVKVSFYREGAQGARCRSARACVAMRNGSAASSVSASRATTPGLSRRGRLTTPRPSRPPFSGPLAARSRYVQPNLGPGPRRASRCGCCSQSSNALHYAVPLTAIFDEGTAAR